MIARYSRLLCSVALLLMSLAAQADVYTYTDADGNKIFTDHPPVNGHAKRIEIGPSNQTSTTITRKLSPPKAAPAPILHYQLLRILVPEPDATIRSQEGDLVVSANSDPLLYEGHNYRLLLDGKPYGEPGRSPVFPLSNIDRGTHQLAVEIVDAQGRTVERTPNQPFHLFRISLAQKRKAHPCEKDDYGVRPECPIADKPKESSMFWPFK